MQFETQENKRAPSHNFMLLVEGVYPGGKVYTIDETLSRTLFGFDSMEEALAYVASLQKKPSDCYINGIIQHLV